MKGGSVNLSIVHWCWGLLLKSPSIYQSPNLILVSYNYNQDQDNDSFPIQTKEISGIETEHISEWAKTHITNFLGRYGFGPIKLLEDPMKQAPDEDLNPDPETSKEITSFT